MIRRVASIIVVLATMIAVPAFAADKAPLVNYGGVPQSISPSDTLSVPALKDTGVTGLTQCAQFSATGTLLGIGAPCGTTSGTVTSVGASVPSYMTVSGVPITSSGVIALGFGNESANLVFAGPASGGAASPGFRALTATDIPPVTGVTNPYFLGTLEVGSGTGQPSMSWPEGSLWLRIDEPQIWQQGVPAGVNPAFVQSASVDNTYTVTLGSTPAVGDYLIAVVENAGGAPTPNTAWTQCTNASCALAGGSTSCTAGTCSYPYISIFYRQVDSTSFSTTQTPASGTGATNFFGATIFEVSGLDPNNFNNAVQAITAGHCAGASGGCSFTASYTTTAPNTLLLASSGAAHSGGTPYIGTGSDYTTGSNGWLNRTISNPDQGSAGASQFAVTTTSAISLFTDAPNHFGQKTGIQSLIIALNSPGAASWFLIGPSLSTVYNGGSLLTSTAKTLNCSTGLSCSVDSLNFNVTETLATNGTALSNIAQIGADTYLGNASGSTANVGAVSWPSCSGAADALTYNTSTHALVCNSAVNAAQLGGATFAAPGAIGGTTPGSGEFSSLQDTGVTGLTQCLHADSVGNITGTGSDCGSGGGGGGVSSVSLSAPLGGGTVTSSGTLGTTSYTAHGILIGNGSSALNVASGGSTAGQVFTSNGSSADPTMQQQNYALVQTGTITTTNTFNITGLDTVNYDYEIRIALTRPSSGAVAADYITVQAGDTSGTPTWFTNSTFITALGTVSTNLTTSGGVTRIAQVQNSSTLYMGTKMSINFSGDGKVFSALIHSYFWENIVQIDSGPASGQIGAFKFSFPNQNWSGTWSLYAVKK